MRKLMWFTVGYAAACFLFANSLFSVLPEWGLYLFAAVVILWNLAAIALRKFPAIFPCTAGIIAGVIVISLFHANKIRPLTDYDGKTEEIRILAASHLEPTDYGYTADGFVTLAGQEYAVKVFLSEEIPWNPGQYAQGLFRLRLTTPEGIRESEYYRTTGIYLTATQKGELTLYESGIKRWEILADNVYFGIWKSIRDRFPQDVVPFLHALLLGDTDELDYVTDTALKLSGIRHVAAVSGLHVGLITGILYRLIGRKRFLLPLAVLPTLTMFAAVSSFTPSVTRACIMAALAVLAILFGREYDPPTALSVPCLAMLAFNPYAVNSVSLQLSVASVAGIMSFSAPLQAWIRKMLHFDSIKTKRGKRINWFAGSIAVSLSALVFTTPISAYYFGTVSLVSPITNLLTIWLIGAIFTVAMVIVPIGMLLPTLGSILGWGLAWPVRLVLTIARLIAKFPLAAVYTASPYICIWLCLLYILLGIFFLTKRKHAAILAEIGAAGLIAAISISYLLPRLASDSITAVYVGQGQSILLQSKGKNLLLDCGGSSDTGTADAVAACLLSQGIFRLDGIAFTHYDRDHTGGFENLMTRVNVNHAFLPTIDEDGFIEDFSEKYDIPYTTVSDTEVLKLGTASISFLCTQPVKTANENSMCVLFEGEKYVILITGDRNRSGEVHLLKEADIPDVDVLVVGHHGSKYATSEELLEAVKPEIAIISAGKDNAYGHPTPEVLERLTAIGSKIYRTDLNGNVTIRRW